MSTKLAIATFYAGLLAATLASAQSIVLLQPPDHGGYGISDSDFGRSFAEDFVLSSDRLIEEIVVWGVGSDADSDDLFTVIFHRDSGGLPGDVVELASGVVPRARSTTGQYVGSRQEYVYYLDLPAAVLLGSGTWWIEIFNTTLGSGSWGWEGGDSDPVHGNSGCASAEEAPGSSWTSRYYDMSILIVGRPAPIFSDGFESGTSWTWSQTIPPIGIPQADFTFMATGLQVPFQNMSTGDQPLSFLWDFGDGITSTETNPIHTYATAGTYTVRLTATNSLGTHSVSKNVTVSP